MVPGPPGKTTIACPSLAKASNLFSISGKIDSSETIALGDSVETISGSDKPINLGA